MLFSFASAGGAFKIPRSEVVELTEKTTGQVYPLFIKTPRSYKSNKGKHYPVIYLTDAPYTFQVASGTTRFPMNSGKMEEAIIVGIAYSKGSRGAASRIRDYTISEAKTWKLKTGNAAIHATFIREQVFSYIEKNYRVSSSKRTFVGNSLGGLFGAFILFNYPDMFSDYIFGSPSVWFNNNDLLSFDVKKAANKTRVYLAVGSLEKPEFGEREDMVAGAKSLSNKIARQSGDKVELKFKTVEDASHATAFPTILIQGLDWIYGKQQ